MTYDYFLLWDKLTWCCFPILQNELNIFIRAAKGSFRFTAVFFLNKSLSFWKSVHALLRTNCILDHLGTSWTETKIYSLFWEPPIHNEEYNYMLPVIGKIRITIEIQIRLAQTNSFSRYPIVINLYLIITITTERVGMMFGWKQLNVATSITDQFLFWAIAL